MAEEHKNEESLPNLDPAVEVVERESMMEKISEKIHHKGDSSSSSSSSDDDNEKKSSSPSSLKSKVYRLFGRERPVHKVLGGGKRTFTPIPCHFIPDFTFDFCLRLHVLFDFFLDFNLSLVTV